MRLAVFNNRLYSRPKSELSIIALINKIMFERPFTKGRKLESPKMTLNLKYCLFLNSLLFDYYFWISLRMDDFSTDNFK